VRREGRRTRLPEERSSRKGALHHITAVTTSPSLLTISGPVLVSPTVVFDFSAFPVRCSLRFCFGMIVEMHTCFVPACNTAPLSLHFSCHHLLVQIRDRLRSEETYSGTRVYIFQSHRVTKKFVSSRAYFH
jgi:hypothetical protein